MVPKLDPVLRSKFKGAAEDLEHVGPAGPLGTTAHKQGRVAGENAAGGRREFAGFLGTQVVKVFDHAVARTGLGDRGATAAGTHRSALGTSGYRQEPIWSGALAAWTTYP
jgi:NADPH-dependent 2,4-dienoyl-CoA reductase/sulfur reductase-like enzyme